MEETAANVEKYVEELKSIRKGLEIKNLILENKSPREVYANMHRKGDSNQYAYNDFILAYINAYIRAHHPRSEGCENPVARQLSKNIVLEYVLNIAVEVANDGTLKFALSNRPKLDDPELLILSYYQNFFDKIPKEFPPPSIANLKSPFNMVLWLRNTLGFFCGDGSRVNSLDSKKPEPKLYNQ